MIMSERMFIIAGAFLFGYCFGYYLFEFMKSKNRKHEIHEFFLSCNKKYGMQCRLFDENIGRDKNDIFLEDDLSYEKKILNGVIGHFVQKNDDCEVSYYVSKRSMSICSESLTMT